MNAWNIIFTTDFAFMVFRVTTPILFTALGAMISRRAGIMNISLEGMMLVGALFGVIGSAYTQSAAVGVLCAIIASLVLSLVFAYFVLKLQSDLILTGIALNLMASGGTVFLLSVLCGDKGVSTSMNSLVVPSIEAASDQRHSCAGRNHFWPQSADLCGTSVRGSGVCSD